MDYERNTRGAHKVLSGVVALIVAGILGVLLIFVVRRLGDIKDACAGELNEMGVCGEERR